MMRWTLTALSAAVGGAAFWQWRSPASPADGPSSPSSQDSPDPAVQALFAVSWSAADGTTLDMSALRGQTLVLNFWATWCPPCVKELPVLDRFAQSQGADDPQGWRVIGVAVDHAQAVHDFLRKHPVSFPVALAGLDAVSLARSLGNAQGGLPFTVVIGRRGQLVARKLGETTEADLHGWRTGVQT